MAEFNPQALADLASQARVGVAALFDNRFEEAEKVFAAHRTSSPVHALGHALVAFIKAFLSFEDKDFDDARSRLHAAAELATNTAKKARKHAAAHHQKASATPPATASATAATATAVDQQVAALPELSPSLEFEVIAADATLFASMIQLMRSGLLESVKAGLGLRNAFNLYKNAWNRVHCMESAAPDLNENPLPLEDETVEAAANAEQSNAGDETDASFENAKDDKEKHAEGENHEGNHGIRDSSAASAADAAKKSSMEHHQHQAHPHHPNTHDHKNLSIHPLASHDLRGGVHFGMGMFGLLLSMLPAQVAKIITALGFEVGEREFAIAELHKACDQRLSDNFHAAWAALILLSFQMFALVFSPLPESEHLAETRRVLGIYSSKYPDGMFWIYLSSRLERAEGDCEAALATVRSKILNAPLQSSGPESAPLSPSPSAETATSTSSSSAATKTKGEPEKSTKLVPWKQLTQMGQLEAGWLELFTFRYLDGAATFKTLQETTTWSKAFCAYMSAVCYHGALQHHQHEVASAGHPDQSQAVMTPSHVSTFAVLKTAEEAQSVALKCKSVYESVAGLMKRRWGRFPPMELFVQRRVKMIAGIFNKKSPNPHAELVAMTFLPHVEMQYLWNGFRQMTTEQLRLILSLVDAHLGATSSAKQQAVSSAPSDHQGGESEGRERPASAATTASATADKDAKKPKSKFFSFTSSKSSKSSSSSSSSPSAPDAAKQDPSAALPFTLMLQTWKAVIFREFHFRIPNEYPDALTQAKTILHSVTGHEWRTFEEEKLALPSALYELAVIEYIQTNYDVAASLATRIRTEFYAYEFEERIAQRCKALLDDIQTIHKKVKMEST